MNPLDPAIAQTLFPLFLEMPGRALMRVFGDGSEKGQALQEFADAVAAVCPQKVEAAAADPGAPAQAPFRLLPRIEISAPGQQAKISFACLPSGHEFTSLALALLHAGGRPPKASSEDLKRTGLPIPEPMRLQTLVQLSCHNCPETVQSLNLIAMLNPSVFHETADGAWFPELARESGAMAAPATLGHGKIIFAGRKSLPEALNALGFPKAAQSAGAAETFDALVVGMGPAGANAAIYLARKGLSVALAGERFGGQILDTSSVENYLAKASCTGPGLAAEMRAHVESHPNVRIFEGYLAQSLAKNPDGLFECAFANGAAIAARGALAATGASWRKLGVPGEAELAGKGICFCPHCDGPLFKGQDVAVIGGGNSGAEAALDLAGVCRSVTLVEYGPQLKADAVLRSALAQKKNVAVETNAQTLAFLEENGKLCALSVLDRNTGRERRIPASGAFVQIGLAPATSWLAGSGAEINGRGEIVCGPKGQTSVPGLFAAGDATCSPFKQIAVAAGSGAAAALGLAEELALRGL